MDKPYKYIVRLRTYVLFFVFAIIVPTVASIMILVISGYRVNASIGIIVLLPIIQAVFTYRLLSSTILMKLIVSVLSSAFVYFISILVINTFEINLGFGYYGYMEFLITYSILSVILWEVTYIVSQAFNNKSNI